jgi:hypothetical protein
LREVLLAPVYGKVRLKEFQPETLEEIAGLWQKHAANDT